MLLLNGFLVTMDIEKAFDSLDHDFLIEVLQFFGFGEEFISWIKILLFKQESCIINNGTTTKYFNLKRGARQGDPISAFLFILCLETLFLKIKQDSRIKGIEIVDHCFLYSAFADDTTFFIKDKFSIQYLVDNFQIFSLFSGLKRNVEKCEVAGIGNLKGVEVADCGMKCINLTRDTTKILGVHFSYNIERRNDKNFMTIIENIQNVLKVWRMRSLTLEGKIVVFKSLAISKIVYQALFTIIQ